MHVHKSARLLGYIAVIAFLITATGCLSFVGRPHKTRTKEEGFPLWYKNLDRYTEIHPGEYMMAVGRSNRGEMIARQQAWENAEEMAPTGAYFEEQSYFYIDSQGDPYYKWIDEAGFKEVIVLYKVVR